MKDTLLYPPNVKIENNSMKNLRYFKEYSYLCSAHL